MKKKYLWLSLALSLGLTSCYDLDKMPKGVLSTAEPFQGVGEIQNYVDRFYESAVVGQGFMAGGGGGIAGADVQSDNLASAAANERLMGLVALSNAGRLNNYNKIRDVNFLIQHAENCQEKTATYKQLLGEAYFFRAWYYFDMFKNYGPVAWVDAPLPPDKSVMQLPRASRTALVDKILGDLDTAINLMKEQSNAATMRLHRDVARALKSEVALYEATWEKYHYEEEKNQAEKFYDTSLNPNELQAKIQDYLTQAIEACKQVCIRNVWNIYQAEGVENSYRALFDTPVLRNNPEVLWYKEYDGDQVGNSVTRYLNTGGGNVGVTASLVDDYLTKDGKPFIGAARETAKKNYPDELKNRDPRLTQTVALPGTKMQPGASGFVLGWPSLGGDGTAFGTNMTGYVMLKHVEINSTGDFISEFKGATPAIQVRYADILLNYAEALAEQDGAANAQTIIEVLKPLRKRVGMPDVDFDREYNQSADYPFKNLDKYIQAVRRERRVEKALEGTRFQDIMRWAAADELIVGKRPEGALFTGSNLEGQYNATIIAKLHISNQGYLLPVPPEKMQNGWQFKTNRDYLLPINEDMLAQMNGLWEQNPGW